MRKKVEKVLIELGITPNFKGFEYICRAIEIISNSKIKPDLVKGIYAELAKEFETTRTAVERCIRHAFSKIDVESSAFIEYLNTDKLSNSTLLYTLAYRLKE